jgi:hypothetical protein
MILSLLFLFSKFFFITALLVLQDQLSCRAIVFWRGTITYFQLPSRCRWHDYEAGNELPVRRRDTLRRRFKGFYIKRDTAFPIFLESFGLYLQRQWPLSSFHTFFHKTFPVTEDPNSFRDLVSCFRDFSSWITKRGSFSGQWYGQPLRTILPVCVSATKECQSKKEWSRRKDRYVKCNQIRFFGLFSRCCLLTSLCT